MAVVVEITDQGGPTAAVVHAVSDFRDRSCCGRGVDGYSDQFGARLGEFDALGRGRFCVGGVRDGHRLHHDRSATTDLYVANMNTGCAMKFDRGHAWQ